MFDGGGAGLFYTFYFQQPHTTVILSAAQNFPPAHGTHAAAVALEVVPTVPGLHQQSRYDVAPARLLVPAGQAVTVLFWHWKPAGHAAHWDPERNLPGAHRHWEMFPAPGVELVSGGHALAAVDAGGQ